jgi:aryl-alcohol dehydrogenase-like predicted oxidoreductase
MQTEGMALLAYSPLLKGIYGDRKKHKQYYNWHLFNNELNLKKLELVEKISKELGISGNQLVLAWLMKHDPQIIPIIGFSRKEQYFENIEAADIRLSDTHMAMLNVMDN